MGAFSRKHDEHGGTLLQDGMNDTFGKESSDGSTDKTTSSVRLDVLLLRWWRWELSMVLVSALAFFALIVILAVEDGKPVHRWGVLTLNAIVAILTTVAGSALTALVGSALSQGLWNGFSQQRTGGAPATTRPVRDLQIFNEASRGPMGSLILLLRHGALSVASLGALATILNVAFATFTQQLVTNEVQNLQAGVAKPFPRSQVYHPLITQSGISSQGEGVDVDWPVLSAIIGAALQGNNSQPLMSGCTTGNCTYTRRIPTLAVHGGCGDVSDELKGPARCSWDDSGASNASCTYRLPTGPSLTWQTGGQTEDRYAIWNATNLLATPSDWGSDHPQVPSIAYPDSDDERTYIMKFATIGLSPATASPWISDKDHLLNGSLPPVQAFECALWPSLDFYDVRVEAGVNNVTLASSNTYLRTVNTDETQGSYFFLDPHDWSVSSSTGYGFAPSRGVDALQMALARLLPYGKSYVAANWNPPMRYVFGKVNDPSFNLIEGLYRNSDSLHNWTANLALELTHSLAKSSPAPETADYDGVAWMPKTYFEIRWYWISLPALVLLLAYTFLFAMIVQTCRRDVLPWKSDAAMLLFAELDPSLRATTLSSGALDRPDGWRLTVNSTKVGLQRQPSDGLIFA